MNQCRLNTSLNRQRTADVLGQLFAAIPGDCHIWRAAPAAASELGARMTAMGSATDNAQELISQVDATEL